MSTEIVSLCYQSPAKEYRKQMGGSVEATSLPSPTQEGIRAWERVGEEFDGIMEDVADALRKAEAAHQGRAADAANASIAEIKPLAEQAAGTARGVKGSLEQQVQYQHTAFNDLPAPGQKLENGRPVQLDPPEKGWVENAGLDDNVITGWMSDYEERQEDFAATSEKAESAMRRYRSETEGVVDGTPRFDQPQQDEPASPPPSSTRSASADFSGTGVGTATPTATSSASAAPAAAPSAASTTTPSPSGPAPTSSSWANSAGVPGHGGMLYRQNPQTGAWERQNPHNGRWAAAPYGPGGPGTGGGPRAAGAPRSAGAPGARAGTPGAQGSQVGPGGRSGVGNPASSGGPNAGANAASNGSQNARGGPMGGRGAQGGGQGEEDEHERPSWLVENEDVFTNDMQRVAPPVLGDSGEGR
ncbi:hypothetical protein [Salinifilum ghardaiensis]